MGVTYPVDEAEEAKEKLHLLHLSFQIAIRGICFYCCRKDEPSDVELMKSFQNVRPDKPHKCTWNLRTTEASPHNHQQLYVRIH